MPFGVSLAPEEFESNLQEKLADLEGVEVIRDDILVMGFSKFLPKPAEVAQPLRDLTTKDAKFTWAKQHDTSLKEVKKLVVNHPVLK